MAKLGVLTIPGKSGTTHRFDAYPLNTVWTPISAVYIMTHRQVFPDGSAEHMCVQLGEIKNLQSLARPSKTATDVRQANCICILQEEDETRRKTIVEDIADMGSSQ